MNPTRTAWTEMVYRGIDPNVGDLYCHRETPGEIWSVWEPTDEERELLAKGGRVRVCVLAEPLPPLAVDVLTAHDSQPVGDHPFKVIPELEERVSE